MNKQQFIEKSLEELDVILQKYRPLMDDVKFKLLIENLFQSKLSECWDMAGEEKDSYWISKLNMIALGSLAFKESEKQRDKEEMRGLRRRDGGPAMAAFSFINRLIETINSLTSKQEEEK